MYDCSEVHYIDEQQMKHKIIISAHFLNFSSRSNRVLTSTPQKKVVVHICLQVYSVPSKLIK